MDIDFFNNHAYHRQSSFWAITLPFPRIPIMWSGRIRLTEIIRNHGIVQPVWAWKNIQNIDAPAFRGKDKKTGNKI